MSWQAWRPWEVTSHQRDSASIICGTDIGRQSFSSSRFRVTHVYLGMLWPETMMHIDLPLSETLQGDPGLVWLCTGRFEQFRFLVQTVPVRVSRSSISVVAQGRVSGCSFGS